MTPASSSSHSISYRKRKPAIFIVHLAALVCVSMWGMSFVSSKVLLDAGMGTVEIYIYRFLLAWLLILAISHKRFRSHSWRDEGMFAMCGICAGSIYFIVENTALQYTLTTNVSLLTSLSPLFTVFLAGLLYRNERADWRVYLGSLIAFSGVACVIFNSASQLEINPLGDILSIGAAVSWAIYSLILKRLNANYDVWYVTRKTFFYGVVTALPFMFLLPDNLHNPLPYLESFDVILNLLFLGLGASMVAYLLWAYSVKHLGAVKAGNYMYFQAPVTMIASYFILGDQITFLGVLGCALIIAGLWFGDWLTRRHNMRVNSR
ncbi:MAG: DMT family transporter [Bacteroidales bacterium]|nr:DMT family transporter [Bacteroidales bacterium]